MNEAPTENTADRRILIKSSPVRCWREEPILIPSYVPAASVSRSVLRPQPLCRYRRHGYIGGDEDGLGKGNFLSSCISIFNLAGWEKQWYYEGCEIKKTMENVETKE